MSIKEDRSRFFDILKGKVRKNLKQYISKGELVGKKEDEYVKIPIHSIDLPNFRFGKAEDKKVGQGGEENVNDQGDGQPGSGQNAGKDPGEHLFETEMSIDDLATILGEELQLPEIKPKGTSQLKTLQRKYSNLAPVGPDGLKHFKSSYKNALKRSIAGGTYNPEQPKVIPIKRDMKFRAPKETKKPDTQAVIFYIMDVSGSMGDEEKRIVQSETFWINAWLKKHYKGLDTRFIIHDSNAHEVSESEFFKISNAGGTLISSSYRKTLEIIEQEYSPAEWNIYIFQFSDGDNWSGEDTATCIKFIQNHFLPIVNSFNYGQVNSKYGSGQYLKDLSRNIQHENLILSEINGRDDILKSIKDFLGKGK